MTFSILPTKLHKPELPVNIILRGILPADSQWARVVLVSAPAGSGKSTIISAWLLEQDSANIWYSLDEWDNDLTQFFSYLIAGIKSIDAHGAEALDGMLEAFSSIGFDGFMKALIQQLHGIDYPFVLVLDDYQIIENDAIHQAIRKLLDHMPKNMQLVLITREDPPLPLAKLRASKGLLELRISDLRFTEAEVKAFFSLQLNLTLQEEQVQHLLRRTEGWIAGLQLTALSMQGLSDVNGFIEAFTDSHYYIMDYLMEEVLEHQTPETKEFLLNTAVLDYFCGELCEAVVPLEAGAGSAIIERLLKTNSFIIPTESSRRWYRYHHLFRDLLRQRLDKQPGIDSEKLHYRAGCWFKTAGREQEAIQHFLKAECFEEAAALIECKWAEMDMQLQSSSWLDLARRLPAAIIEKSPVLAMGYGWALLDMGDVEGSVVWLDKAQDLFDQVQSCVGTEDILVNDRLQFDLLPATVASARGYIAAATGDMPGVFQHTTEALRLIPSDQHMKRGLASMMLAVAHWGMGELSEAESIIVKSLDDVEKGGNPLAYKSVSMALGEVYIQQGRLDEAKALFEELISWAKNENHFSIILASLYLGLAKVAFLLGDRQEAYALLEESKLHGQRYALIDWQYKYYLMLARIYCSEGFLDLARDCLQESRSHYAMNPLPDDVSFEDMAAMIKLAEAGNSLNRPSPNTGAKSQLLKKEYANQALLESLTVRELEVLALIASGLSNQEIGNTLFLALSTVKGYNQTIYGKLQVKRRTEAVVKAKALGLV